MTMDTTDDILTAARARLAAITTERASLDAEEAKLRRMLAAADGQPEPAKLVPLPSFEPIPWPVPFIPALQPHPFMPYQPPIYEPLMPWRFDPGPYCATRERDGMLWRRCGDSDLTGQPYFVGTPLLVDPNMRQISGLDAMGVSLDDSWDRAEWDPFGGRPIRVGDMSGTIIDGDQRYTVS